MADTATCTGFVSIRNREECRKAAKGNVCSGPSGIDQQTPACAYLLFRRLNQKLVQSFRPAVENHLARGAPLLRKCTEFLNLGFQGRLANRQTIYAEAGYQFLPDL